MPLPKRSLGSLPEFDYVLGDRAVIETFKCGARVHFVTKFGRSVEQPPPRAPRVIRDQSTPSRSRAAFAFGNAECDWLAMTTLTWHNSPTSGAVKTALDKLRRAWAVRWVEPMDGWIMEMQARGVPHFHVFHALQSAAGKIIAGMPTRLVRRKKRPTELVGGSFENWLVQTWLACTGEREDSAALAFSRGGICELFRSPDAAGRYVAKESSKRHQKELPAEYAAGLGRWWWLAKRWTPKPRARFFARMENWPWAVPVARIWDAEDLADVLAPIPAAAPAPAGRIYQLTRRPYVSTATTANQKSLPLQRQ